LVQKLTKALNPSWDYLKKAFNNLYIQCSPHDEAIGFWALHFKDKEKMIKTGKMTTMTLWNIIARSKKQ